MNKLKLMQIVVLAACAFAANAGECVKTEDSVFSPGYFWLWSHRLDAGRPVAQLEEMYAHGIRSACIVPFPSGFRRGTMEAPMEPDYLTPEYFKAYAAVVKRARELGMNVWLYDEGGWPSGGACGLMAKADTEGRFCKRQLKFDAAGNPQVVTEPYRGNPPYPSMIEKGAVEKFLEMTHESYARAMPDDIGQTLRFAFTDEPEMVPTGDWDRTELGWTADFGEVFKAKKGYDLLPYAKELVERREETDDRLARIRIDYHEVRADLFVERYVLPIREWCRAHGMISGGHFNGDDVPERTTYYGHGDLMHSMRAMDCPGVDVIWKQLFPAMADRPASTPPFPRYAASAMHQNGGRFALSETFCIYGDGCTPEQMKWTIDYQMVRGINRFVLGYYGMSTARQWMILFAPHSGPVTPYWDFEPHWFKYIERTAAFLTQGHPGAEIAVLYDVRGLWAGGADKEAAAQNHYAVATALDRLNRDYDFVNDESLAAAEVKDGALQVGAMAYRALVLPTSKWLSDGARAKVDAFRAAGGLVTDGADLSKLPTTLAIRGRGRDALEMRVLKRIDGNRSIYFVVNESIDARTVWIDFREKGPFSRYDAETGRLVAAPVSNGSLAWKFPAYGSAIFVTGTEPDFPAPRQYTKTVRELKDGWTVRRLVSHEVGKEDFVIRPVDEQPMPTKLGDWRRQLGETYCGKAVYKIEFESDAVRDVCIDLGRVCWCAGVRLNGADLGNRFFGPFRWETKLAKGRNVLEVTVANLLSVLLGDHAIRSRIAAEYPPSLYYEVKQCQADLQGRESGLFGPVVLQGE